MATIDWGGAARAELFVRSDLPTPAKQCRTTAVSRAEALVANDVLDGFTVTSWSKRVPLDEGADLGAFERDRHNEFASWARKAGVRLAPFFDTRECYSTTTGERQTQLVLPAVCIALYGGDGLVTVAPHAHESGTVSVTDCLDRLADQSDEDSDRERALSVTAD